jgi:1-phosphofructokinase
MSDVTIFAPSPTLTVTVEEHDGEPDVHVHAGGQGVWQASASR